MKLPQLVLVLLTDTLDKVLTERSEVTRYNPNISLGAPSPLLFIIKIRPYCGFGLLEQLCIELQSELIIFEITDSFLAP